MKPVLLFALPTITLLSACGGGGTTSSSGNFTTPPPPVEVFTTLKVFSDGAGVGRGVEADGSETLFIAPEIAAEVAFANQTAGSGVGDFQFSDFAIVQTLPTAVVRQGTATTDAGVVNVTIVSDNSGDAGLVYLEVPGVFDAVFASGSPYGAAPNGSYTYNGVHIIGDRFLGGIEDGNFSLTADFNNKTFSYSAATLSSTLNGSGIVDTVNGRFASGNLVSNVGGNIGTASMYGQLHGTSAQAVSGVFHTNEADPRFGGAFIGSRP